MELAGLPVVAAERSNLGVIVVLPASAKGMSPPARVVTGWRQCDAHFPGRAHPDHAASICAEMALV